MNKHKGQFFERSRSRVLEFLQSAMVVDDMAYLDTAEVIQSATSLQTPGIENAVTGAGTPSERVRATEPLQTDFNTISAGTNVRRIVNEASIDANLNNPLTTHLLSAKDLIDTFAENGITCAVLRPDSADPKLKERALALGRRCDLIILDWALNGDLHKGDQAKDLIVSILKDDRTEASFRRGHLRLIAVYTAESDIVGIADAIANTLKEHAIISSRESELTILAGAARIEVFAKEHVPVAPQYELNRLSVRALPERLYDRFTEMTYGLVSNVALRSLAVLRSNTHQLLTVLRPALDAPYLTHRLLLPEPDDASEYVVALVASELHSILDEYSVGQEAGVDAITAWMSELEPGHIFKIRDRNINLVEMTGLLVSGAWPDWAGSDETTLDKTKDKVANNITSLFCEPSSSTNLDVQFAMLNVLRTRYANDSDPPTLTLGTIIARLDKDGAVDSYWLCLQPRCDSVRLSGPTPFLFVPYIQVAESKQFDLAVIESSNYVRLRLDNKPSRARQFGFTPSDQDRITAALDGSNYYFQGSPSDAVGREPSQLVGKTRYKWLGELKYDAAQRAVNEFAAALARVGRDEYEWLRRHG